MHVYVYVTRHYLYKIHSITELNDVRSFLSTGQEISITVNIYSHFNVMLGISCTHTLSLCISFEDSKKKCLNKWRKFKHDWRFFLLHSIAHILYFLFLNFFSATLTFLLKYLLSFWHRMIIWSLRMIKSKLILLRESLQIWYRKRPSRICEI